MPGKENQSFPPPNWGQFGLIVKGTPRTEYNRTVRSTYPRTEYLIRKAVFHSHRALIFIDVLASVAALLDPRFIFIPSRLSAGPSDVFPYQ